MSKFKVGDEVTCLMYGDGVVTDSYSTDTIVVTFDKELLEDDISKFDCGGIVNSLVNAGWSKGLGAVINSQGIMQSPVVREHAGIPEDQVIMICVAMGYPDDSFPANDVISNRRPISEVATFVGFED